MSRGEFDPSTYEEYLQAGYDPYHAFIGVVPYMIDVARYAARQEAISYRRFHVGSALFAAELDTNRTAILAGANNTPYKGAPKYCAEMNVIDQAAEQGFHHAIGIVIAATNNQPLIQEVTGKQTPTLHPCDACRDKMGVSSIIDPETLIVTVALDEDEAQVHTYEEMKTIYQIEDNDRLDFMTPSYQLDLANWHRRQFIYDRIVSETDNLPAPPALAKLALTASLSAE